MEIRDTGVEVILDWWKLVLGWTKQVMISGGMNIGVHRYWRESGGRSGAFKQSRVKVAIFSSESTESTYS